jgi:hypothetical protein
MTRVLTRGTSLVLSLWAVATLTLAGFFFFDAWQWQISPDAPVPIHIGSIRYLSFPERLVSLCILVLGVVFIVQCVTTVRRRAARPSSWLGALAAAIVALGLYLVAVQGSDAKWTLFGDPNSDAETSPGLLDRSPVALHAAWLLLLAAVLILFAWLWLRRDRLASDE